MTIVTKIHSNVMTITPTRNKYYIKKESPNTYDDIHKTIKNTIENKISKTKSYLLLRRNPDFT